MGHRMVETSDKKVSAIDGHFAEDIDKTVGRRTTTSRDQMQSQPVPENRQFTSFRSEFDNN